MSIMIDSIYCPEGNPLEALVYAFLASNADKKGDPIDSAVVSAFNDSLEAQKMLQTKGYRQTSIIGFNPEIKRVVAFVEHSGGKLTIAKGIVAKVLDTQAGGIDSGELQWVVEQNSDKKFIENLKQQDKELSKAGYKVRHHAACCRIQTDKRSNIPLKYFYSLFL